MTNLEKIKSIFPAVKLEAGGYPDIMPCSLIDGMATDECVRRARAGLFPCIECEEEFWESEYTENQ